MFKDTNDGQTYHDPEAERKAREPMQDLIKESASEFEEKFPTVYAITGWNKIDETEDLKPSILNWHTKQMEKAYNKGRGDEIKELKGTVIDDIIKKLSS